MMNAFLQIMIITNYLPVLEKDLISLLQLLVFKLILNSSIFLMKNICIDKIMVMKSKSHLKKIYRYYLFFQDLIIGHFQILLT